MRRDHPCRPCSRARCGGQDGQCVCTFDDRPVDAHWQDKDCPIGLIDGSVAYVEAPVNLTIQRRVDGAARWNEWHRLCLTWDGRDPEAMAEKRRRLADGMGCTCGELWAARVAAVPFAAKTAAEAFALSVDDHNAVNRPLGKRELSEAEARAIHAPKEGDRPAIEAASIDN